MPDRPVAFKVDEDLPEDIATAFCHSGYDASTATSQGLAGADDGRLSEVVRREGRVLVTLDVDFGDIRAYPPNEYPGIIVFRTARQDTPRILAALRQVLPLLETEVLAGATVGGGGARSRPRGMSSGEQVQMYDTSPAWRDKANPRAGERGGSDQSSPDGETPEEPSECSAGARPPRSSVNAVRASGSQ